MRIKFATTRLQAFFADAEVGDDDEYCEDGDAGDDAGDDDEYHGDDD